MARKRRTDDVFMTNSYNAGLAMNSRNAGQTNAPMSWQRTADPNSFGAYKANMKAGLVQRRDINGNLRWVDPMTNIRADNGMPLYGTQPAAAGDSSSSQQANDTRPQLTSDASLDYRPRGSTDTERAVSTEMDRIEELRSRGEDPWTRGSTDGSPFRADLDSELDLGHAIEKPDLEDRSVDTEVVPESPAGTLMRTEGQQAERDMDLLKGFLTGKDAEPSPVAEVVQPDSHGLEREAISAIASGTPFNELSISRQPDEYNDRVQMDKPEQQEPPEQRQPGGNPDEDEERAASKAGYAGRFDVSRNFLATDKVPDSIFGYPIVSREEDYTPEDIEFFREHPEAGGYYDLGEGSPEDGTEEGQPVQDADGGKARPAYPGAWNNPGNVQKGEVEYDGEAGFVKSSVSEGTFLKFRTPQDGLNAMAQSIGQMVREKIPAKFRAGELPDDRFTIDNLVKVYAPRKDANDTDGYARFVSGWTGLARDQPLDLKNAGQMALLLDALARQDSGHPHADWFTAAERKTAIGKMGTPAKPRSKTKPEVKNAKRK